MINMNRATSKLNESIFSQKVKFQHMYSGSSNMDCSYNLTISIMSCVSKPGLSQMLKLLTFKRYVKFF
jgi:hypothetical protein